MIEPPAPPAALQSLCCICTRPLLHHCLLNTIHPASEALSAASEAFKAASEALSAASEALSAASEAP